MRLTIVQLPSFVSDWRRHRLKDEDLQALESMLLAGPDAGAVIAGTGGVRKIRFAAPSRGGGKSGGFRVIYAYWDRFARVYLILIYGKNEQSNLTASEKAACREIVRNIEASLADEPEEQDQ
jgi:hypothetical protein